jgi:hypothetical protein
MTQSEIEAATQKTVLLFNRLRTPEAIAKIVNIYPEIITIAFSGSFCYDCGGTIGYVDAFIADFKALNKNVSLKAGKTRQISPRSFETNFYVTQNTAAKF